MQCCRGRIFIGDTELMAADIPNAEPMRSAYLTLRMETDVDAERVFSALPDGGQLLMAMQETFFASRFGQVRDRFGMNWMILPRASHAAAAIDVRRLQVGSWVLCLQSCRGENNDCIGIHNRGDFL
jgi:predicted 3-demethylubiquinone-9 3-methyltransferase (glyoxalase superfamily)